MLTELEIASNPKVPCLQQPEFASLTNIVGLLSERY